MRFVKVKQWTRDLFYFGLVIADFGKNENKGYGIRFK